MKSLERICLGMIYVIFILAWLLGIALAQGFWSTVNSIWCPFYAWYLVVERTAQLTGFLS